jgi:hypothetical protein
MAAARRPISSSSIHHNFDHDVTGECLDLLLPRQTRNILAMSSTESEMPQFVKTTSKPVIVMAPQEINAAHVAPSPPSITTGSSTKMADGDGANTEKTRLLLDKLASNLK